VSTVVPGDLVLLSAGQIARQLTDKRWLAFPALVTAFLFQPAVQGWCPPLPMLRRLGLPDGREIDTERSALKALRGDFTSV
jgi:hypothetical protein